MKLIDQKNFDLNTAVLADKELVNSCLDKYLQVKFPHSIWESMRYSVLADGKRIRPVLMLESARVCGGEIQNILPTACALEMLHAQSLIHDDLPCMDNDDFRRGKPTNHKVFGEAVAVLAGDALLSYAPQVIINHTPDDVDKAVLLQVLEEFLHAAGAMGIVGGQVVDIKSENKEIDVATFNYILAHKTGELFKFAMRAGALLSDATEEKLSALTFYGKTIGYAFQIADDILDVTGTLESLGKTPGKDENSHKNTHVSIYGLEESKKELEILCINAQQELLKNNIQSPLLLKIAENIATKVLL
jgi:geranylgeranyl diphosphate synthase type II